MRRPLVCTTLVAAMLAAVSTPVRADAPVTPLFAIAGPDGSFVGGNVQNHTGAGQTVAFTVASGTERYGSLQIKNPASTAHTFLVRGPAGSGPFIFTYYYAGDSTAQVVAGTLAVTVSARRFERVGYSVKAAPTSRAGESAAFR